ncbi:hypothetical protein DYI25_14440 [Mesobacillus boroniphilus]|uniref:Uncharacterized protein n=1 Tax=Mesobacillus boroniphilus TaxID=308892 RepID=A0A944CMC5_9BACI|nr:hypothetical protein [Mesobacillus boroniphilus]MBS8265624.1 hypothetical protein [Mesobacillus boroniphilus]
MKKWKIILAAFSLLLIAGAGYVYYLLEVKTYEVKDEKVEEVVSEDYDIALPEEESSDGAAPAQETADETGEEKDTTAASEESDGQNRDSSNTTTETTSTGSNNKESTTKVDKSSLTVSTDKKAAKTASSEKTDTKQKPKAPAKPAAKEIAAKYEPSFVQLEAQANSKIDALVSHAYSEYKTKQQDGENVDYFYFYSKYSTAGKILERKTDSTFNYVYNALVNELINNGYDSTEAQKFKTAYEAAKKERRSAILNKAKANM